MGKDVVVNGASTECTGSGQSSFLVVPPTLQISLDGAHAATIADHQSVLNIVPFGNCKFKGGALCLPVTPSPWTPGETTVVFGQQPTLDVKSHCTCAHGGKITFLSSGQTNPFMSVDCNASPDARDAAYRDYLKRRAEAIKAQMDAENAADKPPGLGTMLLNTAVETGKEFSGYNDAGKAIDAAKRGDWKSALAHGLMAAPTPLGKVGKAGKIRKAIKGQPTRGKKLPNDEILPPPKRGDAPISKKDGKPIEMHHRDQKPDDPVDEMHPSDHRYGENYQKNHPNTGQKKSKIDRAEFRKWQQRIRREDWDSGRFEQDEEDGQK